MNSRIEFCPNLLALMVHTKFNIQNNAALKFIIEQVEGVEEITSWNIHKYSFLVIIGNMFDKNEIVKIISQKIEEFVSDRKHGSDKV